MAHKQLNARSHASVGKHPDRPSHPALSSGSVGYVQEPSDSRAGGFSATLRRWLLPPVLSAATAALTVTVMAAVTAARSADPTALIPLLAPVVTAVASLVGGVVAGLCHRERALPSALLYGGILAALLCLAGLGAEPSNATAWLTRLMPLPLHALGGLFTRTRPRKAAHRLHG